ncbi:MAG: hypothetical protein JSW40_08355 [Candidatus Omnitrophota bacterium]|nr:MAG: hypothetical protein JSW40_08355 [Candidatus Omnitrophota bacterium]
MNIVLVAVAVLGITGLLFSMLLSLLSRRLKVEEDSRIRSILEVLPGLNCGACGFSGCRAFAEAVAR